MSSLNPATNLPISSIPRSGTSTPPTGALGSLQLGPLSAGIRTPLSSQLGATSLLGSVASTPLPPLQSNSLPALNGATLSKLPSLNSLSRGGTPPRTPSLAPLPVLSTNGSQIASMAASLRSAPSASSALPIPSNTSVSNNQTDAPSQQTHHDLNSIDSLDNSKPTVKSSTTGTDHALTVNPLFSSSASASSASKPPNSTPINANQSSSTSQAASASSASTSVANHAVDDDDDYELDGQLSSIRERRALVNKVNEVNASSSSTSSSSVSADQANRSTSETVVQPRKSSSSIDEDGDDGGQDEEKSRLSRSRAEAPQGIGLSRRICHVRYSTWSHRGRVPASPSSWRTRAVIPAFLHAASMMRRSKLIKACYPSHPSSNELPAAIRRQPVADDDNDGKHPASKKDDIIDGEDEYTDCCTEIFGCSCCASSLSDTHHRRLHDNALVECCYHPWVLPLWGCFKQWFTGMSPEKEILFKADLKRVMLSPDEQKLHQPSMKKLFADYARDAIFNLRIDRCDELIPDLSVQHPIVRVHLVDVTTGNYWQKSDPARPVLYQAEAAQDRHQTFIMSAMTEAYSLAGTGSSACYWMEDILYNERAESVLKPQALLLFEVMEFGSKVVSLEKYPDGFRPLCWGFLKIISAKGKPNFGTSRLQLYQYAPDRPQINRANTPSIYFEYLFQKNVQRLLYPSSLHIHLSLRAKGPVEEIRGRRPKNVLQHEAGRTEFSELWKIAQNRYASLSSAALTLSLGSSSTTVSSSDDGSSSSMPAPGVLSMNLSELRTKRRTRAVGQPCISPDSYLFKVSCAQNGVSCLAFSPNGKYLAAACAEYAMFPIKVYEAGTGGLVFTFSGHYNYIYELVWSHDSKQIISASSDQSARIWNFEDRVATDVGVLPHASFVYTAQLHPRLPMIVTGSYDGVLRIWDKETLQLVEIHDEHATFTQASQTSGHEVRSINSCCFSSEGDRLFTVDFSGYVRIWQLRKDLWNINTNSSTTSFSSSSSSSKASNPNTERASLALLAGIGAPSEFEMEQQAMDHEFGQTATSAAKASMNVNASRQIFNCIKLVSHTDLVGDVLFKIQYTPFGGERVVIYCRDNALYLFNGYTMNLRHKLSGATCESRNLTCCFSPDGTRVLAGSEDGKVYIWNCVSGAVDQVLEPRLGLGLHAPINAVAWHPTQHLVAVAAFGEDYPIMCYEHVPPASDL